MPVYKSTTETFIMGHSTNHANIIEEATSRDQLLQLSGSCQLLQDGRYSSLSRAQSTPEPDVDYRQLPTQGTFAIRDPRDVPSGARRAFKNLIVLGVAFMLLFTAFISLQSLQSSLNSDVGLLSLSSLYGTTVFSCFFAPAVIGHLTTKWTIVLGQTVFLVYFLSNLLPRPYVVVPSSLLLGLFTGPMWSAQATYLTTLAIRYAQMSSELHDFAVNRFNGVFCALLQTSQIWGNLLSAGVLSSDDNHTLYHQSLLNQSQVRIGCGARDCAPPDYFPDGTPPHQLGHVPPVTRHILLGVHAACALTAIAMTSICLDRNEMNALWDKGSISASSQQLFLSTIRMLKDARLQALSPLVFFTGVEQGFVLGDFTKSYVNCALGIHKIGFVMVCFGAVNALASITIGHIARHVKRYPIVVAGTLFNACLLMALLWWLPSSEDLPMFYVISGCLGLCDAIWQTQTNSK
ncbi:hypothetical protein LSH36_407g02024 [Paralvinella palmiformis]|uniref:UNC93-like protein n=1 Tax=Paralvinella palmiformis TaxID=53620 RepID=A0AAD9JCL5_9ANNE|nr:hypothetical protein LSH36_407g02024 [Paralvinella palmiformis]